MIDYEEIWKPVQGWESLYEVSNKGKVKGLDRLVQHSTAGSMFVRKGTMLTEGTLTGAGYLVVTLSHGKNIKFVKKVHQLVAQVFITNPDNKMFVNHKDGNKQNNNDWNLEWSTIDENNDHAIETGLNNQTGINNGNVKLTEADVLMIRRLINSGISQYSLARTYNVSQFCISAIKTGKSWSHLNENQ